MAIVRASNQIFKYWNGHVNETAQKYLVLNHKSLMTYLWNKIMLMEKEYLPANGFHAYQGNCGLSQNELYTKIHPK